MRTIKHKKNYNNKFDCNYYTVLRPISYAIWQTGERVSVEVAGEYHHEAVLLEKDTLLFEKIDDYLAYMDMGIDASQYRLMLLEAFPKLAEKGALLSKLLFKKIESETLTEAETVKELATNEKIALFCNYFKMANGIQYRISKAEVGMIKNVEINDDLLERYFNSQEWWAKVKSVTNYVKNINQIRTLVAKTSTDGHPNGWDAAYFKGLDGTQIGAYYKHLSSLGLTAVKDRLGNIVNYEKK